MLYFLLFSLYLMNCLCIETEKSNNNINLNINTIDTTDTSDASDFNSKLYKGDDYVHMLELAATDDVAYSHFKQMEFEKDGSMNIFSVFFFY